MPDQRTVFVSHIATDAPVAAWLKDRMNSDYLGLFEVFVSSDAESVSAGEDWLEGVRRALSEAQVLITLCSPSSIRRPWINFEIGAAWILGKTIIPLCHAGLTPRDLSIPLSLRQGMILTDGDGLQRLYSALSREFGCGMPDKDFEQLAQEAAQAAESAARGRPDEDLDPDVPRDRVALAERLKRALEHSDWKWRTPSRLAEIGGTSEEAVADVLYADPDVRFAKDENGKVIVGLTSRVGHG